VLASTPEVQAKIASGLNPTLTSERDQLQQRLDTLEQNLHRVKGQAEEEHERISGEKTAVEEKLAGVTAQLKRASNIAASKLLTDVFWADFARRTLMPKQSGRVPFHHSQEVALRGYAAAAGGQRVTPVLQSVSWSKLEYNEGGLHRGYHAGIIFKGNDFVPGITFTHRRRGEGLPAGQPDYFWRLPNIYFGDYLEVSSGADEPESPLSWRDYEFQVKNPEGHKSEWIPFTYPFDDNLLDRIRLDSAALGEKLLAENKPAEAIEPLRKAYVFADRMFGIENMDTLKAKKIWEDAREKAALGKLRFRPGVRLKIVAGEHMGKEGELFRLMLNHFHAYYLKTDGGEEFQAADNQVEMA